MTAATEAEERRRKAYRMEQWSGLLDREGLAGVMAEIDREHDKELRNVANRERRLGIVIGFAAGAGIVRDDPTALVSLTIVCVITFVGDIGICWLARHLRWVKSED